MPFPKLYTFLKLFLEVLWEKNEPCHFLKVLQSLAMKDCFWVCDSKCFPNSYEGETVPGLFPLLTVSTTTPKPPLDHHFSKSSLLIQILSLFSLCNTQSNLFKIGTASRLSAQSPHWPFTDCIKTDLSLLPTPPRVSSSSNLDVHHSLFQSASLASSLNKGQAVSVSRHFLMPLAVFSEVF